MANKSTARTPSTTVNITTINSPNNTNTTATTAANQGPRTPPRAVNPTIVHNNNLPASGFVSDTTTTANTAGTHIRNQNVGNNKSSSEEEFPVYNLLLHSSDTQVKRAYFELLSLMSYALFYLRHGPVVR